MFLTQTDVPSREQARLGLQTPAAEATRTRRSSITRPLRLSDVPEAEPAPNNTRRISQASVGSMGSATKIDFVSRVALPMPCACAWCLP